MKKREAMSQEQAFLEREADAWIRRNPSSTVVAPPSDPVLAALASCRLADRGALLDVGGAAGRIAAGFLRDHPAWTVGVVEPSGEAIEMGRRAFPGVRFEQGTLTNPLPLPSSAAGYDVVVLCGVLCWIERGLLSHAIANADTALLDGGLLVISDFDAPYQRANQYAHQAGLFTFKQDYPACFQSLGTYHLQLRRSYLDGNVADEHDPYDQRWYTAVLRKDLHGRYSRGPDPR